MSDNAGIGCVCGCCTFMAVCFFGVILISGVFVIGSLWYMKANYQTTEPCVALSKAVAEEMPTALNDLAVKYPKKVGIIRGLSFLVDDIDDKIKELTEIVLTKGFQQKEDGRDMEQSLSCFGHLIIADIDRKSFRKGIKDSLEESLNLSSGQEE